MRFEPDHITKKVKEIIHRHDPEATVILFGSRAGGDWWEESDWDFLILTDKNDRELFDLDKQIRNDVLEQIEWVDFEMVQTIVRNKTFWDEKMCVSPFYESIKEDGIIV